LILVDVIFQSKFIKKVSIDIGKTFFQLTSVKIVSADINYNYLGSHHSGLFLHVVG